MDAGVMDAGVRELDGTAAVISGAAGGIGRAAVEALVEQGATVIALDRDASALAVARRVWGEGAPILAVTGDVAETDDVATAFAVAERTGLPLRTVVTCAGVAGTGRVESLSNEEWSRVLRINLRGTFLCCRAAARAMIPLGTGSIVTLSSSLAFTGGPGRAHYAASKAAVAVFTKALALEVAPHGIRANSIAPGTIDTAMARQTPGRTEEEVQRNLRRNPLGHAGTPQDVVRAILYLVGSGSAHVTGQTLHLNGGSLMP